MPASGPQKTPTSPTAQDTASFARPAAASGLTPSQQLPPTSQQPKETGSRGASFLEAPDPHGGHLAQPPVSPKFGESFWKPDENSSSKSTADFPGCEATLARTLGERSWVLRHWSCTPHGRCPGVPRGMWALPRQSRPRRLATPSARSVQPRQSPRARGEGGRRVRPGRPRQ